MLGRISGLILIVAVAAAAGLFSYLEIGVELEGESGLISNLPKPSELLGRESAVQVSIASAVTKQGWMEAAVEEFEAAWTCRGLMPLL